MEKIELISKIQARKILTQKRIEKTKFLISSPPDIVNSLYYNIQKNLFSILNKILLKEIKTNNKYNKENDKFRIAIYIPFKNELEILHIFYGTNFINKIFDKKIEDWEITKEHKSKISQSGLLNLKSYETFLDKSVQGIDFLIPSISENDIIGFKFNDFDWKVGKYNILEPIEGVKIKISEIKDIKVENDSKLSENKNEVKSEYIIPDVIITPLHGFDSKLNRVGYGVGNYDRTFQKLNEIKDNIVKIGVCYDDLYFESPYRIEINEFDIPLDFVVTEKNVYQPLDC